MIGLLYAPASVKVSNEVTRCTFRSLPIRQRVRSLARPSRQPIRSLVFYFRNRQQQQLRASNRIDRVVRVIYCATVDATAQLYLIYKEEEKEETKNERRVHIVSSFSKTIVQTWPAENRNNRRERNRERMPQRTDRRNRRRRSTTTVSIHRRRRLNRRRRSCSEDDRRCSEERRTTFRLAKEKRAASRIAVSSSA